MPYFAELGLGIDSKPADRAAKSLSRLTGQAGRTEVAVSRMGGAASRAFLGISAAIGGALSVQGIGRAAEEYTNMSNRLVALGSSHSEAAKQIDQLGKIANRTRSPLSATSQLYTRLSLSADSLGASQVELMDFTEAVGLALASSGTSATEAQGALLQLSQAMAGGVVRAEEFNSIIEGAPGLLMAVSRGIDGVDGDLGKLRQMMLAGELTSEKFFDALLSQSDALEEAFGKTVPTIGQALTVLGNNFTMMIGRMDQTVGVSSAIAQAILFLADNLDRMAVYAGVAAGVFGAQYVAGLVAATFATRGLSGALVVLRGALMRTGIGLLVVGIGELVFRFTELVRKTGSVGEAFRALGAVASEVWGRIGQAVDAAGLYVQAFIRDAISGIQRFAAEMLTQAQRAVDGFISAFQGLGQKIITAISGAIQEVVAAAGQWASDMVQVGKDIVGGLVKGIGANADTVGSASRKAVQGAIRDTKDALDSNSPSRVFMGIGKDMMDGMAIGIKAAADGPANAAGSATKGAVDKAVESLNRSADMNSKAAENYRATADTIVKGLTAPLESIKALKDAVDAGTSTAKDVADVAESVVQTATTATRAATTATRAASGTVREASSVTTKAMSDIDAAIQQVGETAQKARNSMASLFDSFSQGFVNGGFKGAIDGLTNSLKQLAAQGLSRGLQSLFGMGSGSGGGGLLGGLFGGSAFGAGLKSTVSGFMSGGIGGAAKAIGSAVSGGIGGFAGALGSLAPIIGGVGLLFSGLRTKTKELDAGLTVTATAAGQVVKQFRTVEKSRFWGLSRRRSTSTGPANATLRNGIAQSLDDMRDGVRETAASLGIGSRAFRRFSESFRISTKGMTEDQAAAAVATEMARLEESFARLAFGNMRHLIRSGETARQTLESLSVSLTAVNGIYQDLFGRTLGRGLLSGEGARRFVDVFGSIDAALQASANYMERYYSDQERLGILNNRLAKSFSDLGLAMPKTLGQLRGYVDAFQKMGDTETTAQLIGLSDAFANSIDMAAQVADTQMQAMQSQLQAMQSQLQSAESALGSLGRISEMGFTSQAQYLQTLAAAGQLPQNFGRGLGGRTDISRVRIQRENGQVQTLKELREEIYALRSDMQRAQEAQIQYARRTSESTEQLARIGVKTIE